jgi:hypothetical protein
MLQQENDPEYAKFMADNQDVWRFASMFIPGLPWDLPVNTPLWLRRYVEAAATNVYKDQMGEKPDDYGAWQAFVTDIDHAKNISDVATYAVGTVAGSRSYLELPGMVADAVGNIQGLNGQDGEQDDGAAFVSPTNPPPATPAPPIPTPQRRAQQNVTDLEAAATSATADITAALTQSPGP